MIHNSQLTQLDEQGKVVNQRFYNVNEHFIKQKAILIDNTFYFTDYLCKTVYTIDMLLDDAQAFSSINIGDDK